MWIEPLYRRGPAAHSGSADVIDGGLTAKQIATHLLDQFFSVETDQQTPPRVPHPSMGVKRRDRVVHADKQLCEKCAGRNDPARAALRAGFRNRCMRSGDWDVRRPRSLFFRRTHRLR